MPMVLLTVAKQTLRAENHSGNPHRTTIIIELGTVSILREFSQRLILETIMVFTIDGHIIETGKGLKF